MSHVDCQTLSQANHHQLNSTNSRGGDNSVVERRASDRKVADRWFDSQTGNALLCP